METTRNVANLFQLLVDDDYEAVVRALQPALGRELEFSTHLSLTKLSHDDLKDLVAPAERNGMTLGVASDGWGRLGSADV